jgi:beta-mannosidase
MFGGKISDLDTIIKVSQYSQFEGLRYALESNIRRALRNSGSFPWQFNEPYPNCLCTSQIDYYGNPKPAWYAMKNAYRALYPSLSFDTVTLGEFGKLQASLRLCGNPSDVCRFDGKITFKWEAFGTPEIIAQDRIALDSIKFGSSLGTINVDAGSNDIILLRLTLELNSDQSVINEYLFARGQDLSALINVKSTEISLLHSLNEARVKNTGESIAYFVFLSAGDDTFFRENYFCLLPDEESVIPCEDKTLTSGHVFRAEGLNCKTEIV